MFFLNSIVSTLKKFLSFFVIFLHFLEISLKISLNWLSSIGSELSSILKLSSVSFKKLALEIFKKLSNLMKFKSRLCNKKLKNCLLLKE